MLALEGVKSVNLQVGCTVSSELPEYTYTNGGEDISGNRLKMMSVNVFTKIDELKVLTV